MSEDTAQPAASPAPSAPDPWEKVDQRIGAAVPDQGAAADQVDGDQVDGEEIDPADLVAPLAFSARVLTDIVAPAWEVTDAECDRLGEASAQLVALYFPKAGDKKVAAWLGLGLAVTGIAGPRLAERRPLRLGRAARAGGSSDEPPAEVKPPPRHDLP